MLYGAVWSGASTKVIRYVKMLITPHRLLNISIGQAELVCMTPIESSFVRLAGRYVDESLAVAVGSWPAENRDYAPFLSSFDSRRLFLFSWMGRSCVFRDHFFRNRARFLDSDWYSWESLRLCGPGEL